MPRAKITPETKGLIIIQIYASSLVYIQMYQNILTSLGGYEHVILLIRVRLI